MYRLYLRITTGGTTTQYDATDELRNWADVSLSYKRDGLSGVVRSFSTEFEFVGAARAALVAAYIADGVRTAAYVVFQQRDAIAYTYSTLFTCTLDFSTFRYDALVASVNAIDNSIAGKLKAQASQKYQWAVSSLTGSNVTYHHLPMLSTVGYVFGGYTDEDTQTTSFLVYAKSANQACYTTPKLLQVSSEIAVAGTSDFNDVPYDAGVTADIERKVYPFFTAQVGCTATVRMRFTLGQHDAPYPSATVSLLQLVLAKISTDIDGVKSLSAIDTFDISSGQLFNYSHDVQMAEGDALCLYVLVTASEKTSFYVPVENFQELSVTYEAQDVRTLQIRAISPVTLLQAILDKICGTGSADRVTGSISMTDDRYTHTMLMAAESVRGLDGAQIYTSWQDFRDMMDTQFGCVPVIDEDTRRLTFQPRTALFTTTIARVFTADEVRDIEVHTAEDMLASKVSIGYQKQEYDSVNGRDEWRWTAEYNTGIDVSESEVQLICPYRGDAYGIEFLTLTRAQQTTDKDADEDIFLADCGSVGGVLTMRIDVPVSGIIAVNQMPNARYSQYYMAIANAFQLGRLGTSLAFTSIGGNNEAVVGGRAVTANISLAGYTTLKPMELTFTTGVQTQFNWSGLITLPYGGKTYRGWLKDVRFGVGHDKVVQYTLLVNQIS